MVHGTLMKSTILAVYELFIIYMYKCIQKKTHCIGDFMNVSRLPVYG